MIQQILTSLGIIGGILLIVKLFLDRAKTDSTLASLQRENEQKKKEAYAREVGRLEKEIEDATIEYRILRDGFNNSDRDS